MNLVFWQQPTLISIDRFLSRHSWSIITIPHKVSVTFKIIKQTFDVRRLSLHVIASGKKKSLARWITSNLHTVLIVLYDQLSSNMLSMHLKWCRKGERTRSQNATFQPIVISSRWSRGIKRCTGELTSCSMSGVLSSLGWYISINAAVKSGFKVNGTWNSATSNAAGRATPKTRRENPTKERRKPGISD